MKINLTRSSLSLQVILFLIVLLTYTFFFVDEELLVSLLSTFVLIGVYNLLSTSLDDLFVSNINLVFRQFSVYILMNLTILGKLIIRFDSSSLLYTYTLLYYLTTSRFKDLLGRLGRIYIDSINLLLTNSAIFSAINSSFSYMLSTFKLPLILIKSENMLSANYYNFTLKVSFYKLATRILTQNLNETFKN